MKHRPTQRGAAALMLMMSLVIAGLGFVLIKNLAPEARLRAQDEATDAALAMAKAVLIGYASSAAMSKTSVGNLLCPDLNDDGIAYSTGFGCAGAANQSLRLGRMPWRTLGSPEMRDGSGARLWYAVSDNFRSFQPAASNSDTSGTITVRDAAGNILHDASTTFIYATSATTAAESLLKKSNATLIKTLSDNTTNALISAANIALADRTATIKSAWPNASPDCSWLDPDKKPISGWANNQWNKHLYYQIDQRNLIRDSNANIAAGALAINDRPGYQLVVIAAGRALTTQTRTTTDPAQFFEGKNAHASRTGGATNPSKTFEQRPVSDTFNDQLAY